MNKIITFYSFKGGVGRSMALANISYLLAQWGYKVLIIDWDLEAPGLENFFKKINPIDTSTKPGVINILTQGARWQDAIFQISTPTGTLHLISAGKRDEEYYNSIRQFDIRMFYENKNGGQVIEGLRNAWRNEYDFVLIDSRTGITDIGGICTIQLPDLLVLLFTPTDQSFDGIRDVAKKAFNNQLNLQLDRANLLALPIPSRIERTAEYHISNAWLKKFALGLEDIYNPWLAKSVDRLKFIESTVIPHLPAYSYGEELAVTDGMTGAGTLTSAYQALAALIANHLDYAELLNDQPSRLIGASTKHYKAAVAEIKRTVRMRVEQLLQDVDTAYYEKTRFLIDSYVNEEIELIDLAAKDKMMEFWGDEVFKKIRSKIPVSQTKSSTQMQSEDGATEVNKKLTPKIEKTPVEIGSILSGSSYKAILIAIIFCAVVFVLQKIVLDRERNVVDPEKDSLNHLVLSSRYVDSAGTALRANDTVGAQSFFDQSAQNALNAHDTARAIVLYKERLALNVSETGSLRPSPNSQTAKSFDSLIEAKYKTTLVTIGVFYVRIGSESGEHFADSLVKALRTYPHFVVVKKELPEKYLKTSGYALAGHEIRYNTNELGIAEELRTITSQTPGLTKLPIRLRVINYDTPGYVSVFFVPQKFKPTFVR